MPKQERKSEDTEEFEDFTMSQAKQKRDTRKAMVQKELDDIKKVLKTSPVNIGELKVLLRCLSTQMNSYNEATEEYLNHLIRNDQTSEYRLESEQDRTLKKAVIMVEVQCQDHIKEEPTPGGGASALSTQKDPYRLKLPKRELPKFDGDVRKWLTFWASFDEIHKDKNIPIIEKFNYLVQAMVPNSLPYSVVTSFPIQPNNYSKAVNLLQERYGRNSMLIKVYVRDLLGLVVENRMGRAQEFTSLVTELTSQIRNLESLGVTQNQCAQILYPVVESCLPNDVMEAWQRNSKYEEELSKLMEFLEEEVKNKTERDLAQAFISKNKKPVSSGTHSDSGGGGKSSKSRSPPSTAASLAMGENTQSPRKKVCVFCDLNHHSDICLKAMHLSSEEKKNIVIRKGHCLNCLKKGHKASACQTKHLRCFLCRKPHYTIMCPSYLNGSQQGNSTLNEQAGTSNPSVRIDSQVVTEFGRSVPLDGTSKVTSATNRIRSPAVPLQIHVVNVHGTNGKIKQVRLVMDPGSQRSFVTTALAHELELPRMGEENIISDLFGGQQTEEYRCPIVKLMVSKLDGTNYTMFNVSTVDVIIRSAPPTKNGIWVQDFQKKGVTFFDINSTSDKIDVLVGDDVAAKIYTGRIHHLSYGPSAMETVFGWGLCGKLPIKTETTGALLVSTLLSPSTERPLSDLWALESIGIKDPAEKISRKELEEKALEHFEKSATVNKEGRIEVELPFLTGMKTCLPSNYFIAERRLKLATKKLQSTGYLQAYDYVFKQWESENIIEEVEQPAVADSTHYLPHHPVIKTSNTTTPIRPVFDASAKEKGKYSLNDCLEKGPNLLELIPDLLIRFRIYKVGAVADIKKAFQMISVKPEHRDFLRFLWWEDLSCTKIKVYRHTRVVFGVTSSPFLLGATIHHIMKEAEDRYEKTALILKKNMYVDNFVGSFKSTEEAQHFQLQSRELLSPYQFDLRGWEFSLSKDNRTLNSTAIVPVLGLSWKTKEDTLSLDISTALDTLETSSTKRNVLSLCHMLFDPLGVISPFILQGKFILRQCHEEKLGWDTPLPHHLAKEFGTWKNQIPEINRITLPRHVHFDFGERSLHTFCDASKHAYAAVVYLKVETKTNPLVQMIISKARVAPKKEITIPRLEVISCLIGARLQKTVREALCEDIPYYMWSDSSTALAWIKGTGPWSVFVQNRVEEIRSLTEKERWFHIPGEHNPADLPSRGGTVKKLFDCRWWEGPAWLRQPPTLWPTTNVEHNTEEVERERKKTIVGLLVHPIENEFLNGLLRFSSYQKIVRVIAYTLRFIHRIKLRWKPDSVPATAYTAEAVSREEWEAAEAKLLVQVQQQHGMVEETLVKLNPYRDENGLLRIRSRLIHEDTLDFLHPIVLPGDSEIVKLLILEEHERNSHGGIQFTLSQLRNRYWILNGKRTVRRVINKCAVCRRFTAEKLTVPQAPLPKLRTGELTCFATTGVDMAGPLHLKNGSKVWIAVFTCATYRAIHLELTDTLSTEGFLQCLRRFVARRGRPQTIYSDNGLNFTGASRIFRKVNWRKIEKYAVTTKINWIFNPPSAAWWGGWWERLIGLLKQLLRRILGNQVVNYEELLTIIIEMEEVLNNRPLTALTEEANDPIALTPNHFARNSSMAYLPDIEARDGRCLRGTYKKLKSIREALRSRFRLEYLGFLRQQQKNKKYNELKVGDLVLVENDLQKRLDWPLAVVEEPIGGVDGIIRTYRIRTKMGEFIRPAQRLIPLEIIDY